MARLTALACLLAVLLLAANAYARIITTISTIEIDKVTKSSNSQMSCHEQIESEKLNFCQLYLADYSQRLAYDGLCCFQMKRFEDKCQCDALEQYIRDVEREYEGHMQDVIKRAGYIPVRCQLSQSCYFQSDSL